MRAVDLIRKKRDSGELSREELGFLVSGYTRGDIPDYQMAAWLMAVWIRGLNSAEIAALTEVMLYSGEVLAKIHSGDEALSKLIPPQIFEVIKAKKLFGWGQKAGPGA
jgi:thymidine phosphorylase